MDATVGLLALAGICAALRGARLVCRGLRQASSLDVVRGIRMAVVALAAGFFALSLLSANTGFLVLGALVLGEELYETGLLAVVIRLGDRSTPWRRSRSAAPTPRQAWRQRAKQGRRGAEGIKTEGAGGVRPEGGVLC